MQFYPPPKASLDVWLGCVPEAPAASGGAGLVLRQVFVTNQYSCPLVTPRDSRVGKYFCLYLIQLYTFQRSNWKICTVTLCELYTLIPHLTLHLHHIHRSYTSSSHLSGAQSRLAMPPPQTLATQGWAETHQDTAYLQYSLCHL